jgi:hypothetical protein
MRQVFFDDSTPFSDTLPEAPNSINTDAMTEQQFREALLEGIHDLESGNIRKAAAFFAEFRSKQS